MRIHKGMKISEIIGAILICLSVFFISCGDKKKSTLKPGATLVLLTSADSPPFEYFATKEGKQKLVGYDIDLANRIGEYLGYTIQIEDRDHASLIPALSANQVDGVIAGMANTEDRRKHIDFSKPYYQARNGIVVRKDGPLDTRNEFDSTNIAVHFGSSQEQYAKIWAQKYKHTTIVPMNRNEEMIQGVLAGKLDGAILDETPALVYVKNSQGQLAFRPLEKKKIGYGIAFPKGSPLVKEFDKALAHLQSIGYMDKLAERWLLSEIR